MILAFDEWSEFLRTTNLWRGLVVGKLAVEFVKLSIDTSPSLWLASNEKHLNSEFTQGKRSLD